MLRKFLEAFAMFVTTPTALMLIVWLVLGGIVLMVTGLNPHNRTEIGLVCVPRALEADQSEGYETLHALALTGSFDDRYTAVDAGPADCTPGEIELAMERTTFAVDSSVGVVFVSMGDIDRSNFDPSVIVQP